MLLEPSIPMTPPGTPRKTLGLRVMFLERNGAGDDTNDPPTDLGVIGPFDIIVKANRPRIRPKSPEVNYESPDSQRIAWSEILGTENDIYANQLSRLLRNWLTDAVNNRTM